MSTVWAQPLDYVDPNNAPIAGGGQAGDPDMLDGNGTPIGHTVRFSYDDDLTDGVGLDGGMTLAALDGGDDINLNVTSLLNELESDGISLGAGSKFSGVARVSPTGEVNVSIRDNVRRKIGSGTFSRNGELITWSTKLYDGLANIASYGTVVETKVIDAENRSYAVRQDSIGRQLETIDPLGNISTRTYDNNGNVLSSRDPNGTGYDAVYDIRNRQLSVTDTVGDTTSREYDLESNVTATIDAKGNRVTCKYNALDSQFECTDRLGGVTQTRFDQNTNVLWVTDSEGSKTEYGYDELDRTISITHPDHVPGSSIGQEGYGIVEFDYDPLSRRSVSTDQTGATQTRIFDISGRLKAREYRSFAGTPEATAASSPADVDQFEHDLSLRISKAISGRYSNEIEWTYDEIGRQATEKLSIANEEFTTQRKYTPTGRINEVVYPNGQKVLRTFDGRNLLETVSLDTQKITTRSYDAGRRLDSTTFGNGVNTSYGYRLDNQLDSITAMSSGQLVDSFDYSYDSNKNVIGELRGGVMAGFSWSALRSDGSPGFDDDDRLVGWKRDDNSKTKDWTLSLVGNWLESVTDGMVQQRNHSSSHEIDSIDGATVVHDLKGNLVSGAKFQPKLKQSVLDALEISNNQLWSQFRDRELQERVLNWDFDNLLYKVEATTGTDTLYQYDALGRRVRKQGTDQDDVFVYDGDQVVAEYDLTSATPNLKDVYVYGSYIDEPIFKSSPDSSIGDVYYTHDRRFSVSALTDSTGAVVERVSYDIYGSPTITDATLNLRFSSDYRNAYLYTGRRFDEESGLYYFRNRMYSSELGRFVNRDPLGFVDGMSLYRGYFGAGGIDPMGLDNWQQYLGYLMTGQWPLEEVAAEAKYGAAGRNGLGTGWKAARNGLTDSAVSLDTLGTRDGNDFGLNAEVTQDDIINGYDFAHGSGRVSGEIGSGLVTGGLAKLGKLGTATAVWDLAGNLVGAGQNGCDMLKNGLTLENGLGMAGSLLGGAGAVKGLKDGLPSPKLSNNSDLPLAPQSQGTFYRPDLVCFVAGTGVLTYSENHKVLSKNIENVRVGDRVVTTKKALDNSFETKVEPCNWKKIKLLGHLQWSDGTIDKIEVESLQPQDWLAANRLTVGSQVPATVDLQTMGFPESVLLTVVDIQECPEIRAGPGQVVLTTINHLNASLYDVTFVGSEGNSETVRTTKHHKFFRESDSLWVSTYQLTPGDKLQGVEGSVHVLAVKPISGIQTVYNMTVEHEHVYRVSKLGVLVHNDDCVPDAPNNGKLYRGVPGNGTEKARLGQQGIAKPRGTRTDSEALRKHVLSEDVDAGVTSWSTSRDQAARFSGSNGTIIEVDAATVADRVVPRPNVGKYAEELEVLLKGVIKGTPTKP